MVRPYNAKRSHDFGCSPSLASPPSPLSVTDSDCDYLPGSDISDSTTWESTTYTASPQPVSMNHDSGSSSDSETDPEALQRVMLGIEKMVDIFTDSEGDEQEQNRLPPSQIE